jgi:hypothetical protein
MRETKWTKGLWTVGFHDGSGPEYITSSDAKPLAKVRWGCSCCESQDDLTEEEKANANLFAAAPELYEALELITSHFNAKDNDAVTNAKNELLRVAPEFSAYFQFAAAAMKKARGE